MMPKVAFLCGLGILGIVGAKIDCEWLALTCAIVLSLVGIGAAARILWQKSC